jgi:hypothetical protein
MEPLRRRPGGHDLITAARRAPARMSRCDTTSCPGSTSNNSATTSSNPEVPPQAPSSGSTSSSSGGAVYGVQALPVQCGYGVAGSSGVSCTFANNAFYEYWQASSGDPSMTETIRVWSAEGQQYYPLSCSSGNGVVDCTGSNSAGVSLDARFTTDAVSAYTSSLAAAYSKSGKLGPDG